MAVLDQNRFDDGRAEHGHAVGQPQGNATAVQRKICRSGAQHPNSVLSPVQTSWLRVYVHAFDTWLNMEEPEYARSCKYRLSPESLDGGGSEVVFNLGNPYRNLTTFAVDLWCAIAGLCMNKSRRAVLSLSRNRRLTVTVQQRS